VNNKIKLFWIVNNVICWLVLLVLISRISLLPPSLGHYSQIRIPTNLPSIYAFLQASTLKMEAVFSSKMAAM
jgi:hypothetical protein